LIGLLRATGRALLATPRRLAWVPVLLWLGLITWLSARPSQDLARLGWSSLLVNLAHAPLFGLLAMWMALGLPRAGGWPVIERSGTRAVLALVLVCGVLDELHQYLGGRGRTFSVLDVVTDVTGAACLLAVAAYVGRPDAELGGLGARVGAGLALCLAAAALATYGPRFLPLA
jgi:hypothetical protein